MAMTFGAATFDRTATMKRLLAFGAFVIASPAAAQMTNCVANGPFVNCTAPDGTYTTCNRTGTIVNCSTMGNGSPSSTLRPSGTTNGGAAGSMMDFFRSMKERRVQSRVTKALRAGDCKAAVDEAFKGSDLSFAVSVQTYCQRRP